jgi:hypothetical protein
MPQITSEMLYRLALEIRDRAKSCCNEMDDIHKQIGALRMHLIATRHDLRNIWFILGRQDQKLARIERRLENSEVMV